MALIALASLTVQIVAAQNDNWTINVDNVDIKQFIADIARITGRTIVIEPRVSGNVTVSSDQSLSVDGVWMVFRSVMRAHSFEIIENEGIYTVVSTAIARTFGGARSELEDSLDNRLVTKLVRLTHIDSVEMVKLARNISPNYGHLAAISDPNVLIITDYADNTEALVNLIQDLDQPQEIDLKVIKLEKSLVSDTARLIEELGFITDGDDVRVIANENNNTLVVRGQPNKVNEVVRAISVLDQESQQGKNVRVFNLRFADAATTAELIRKIMSPDGGGQSVGADTVNSRIEADEQQNAIVVRGSLSQIADVESLIADLDVRRAQALIEAAIVEITLSDSDSFAIELGVADNANENSPVITTSVSGLITALMQNLQSGTGNGEDYKASDALATFNSPTLGVAKVDPDGLSFGAIMNALATQTQANFLSTPHITALDNAESQIIVGQEIPIRSGNIIFQNTGTPVPQTQTTRKPIGVELTVTPFINHDDTIRMVVFQKVENVITPELGIGQAGFADIVTSVRTIKTEVIADNGQTIVLGGLIGDRETNSVRKVPLLGDIPLLGNLFRSRSNTVEKRHLLVFIRPTVLLSPEKIQAENERKFKPIWELNLEANGKGDNNAEDSVTETPALEDYFDR